MNTILHHSPAWCHVGEHAGDHHYGEPVLLDPDAPGDAAIDLGLEQHDGKPPVVVAAVDDGESYRVLRLTVDQAARPGDALSRVAAETQPA